MIKNKQEHGIFKSVFMAYFILILHVLLLLGLGLIVLFFQGIIQYMGWILLGGATAICVSGYLFYKRMKTEGKTLNEMLKSSMFNGRQVEISFLGGFASIHLGRPYEMNHLPKTIDETHQLEDPVTVQIRELTNLARLLENNLITIDEYNKVKSQILMSSHLK